MTLAQLTTQAETIVAATRRKLPPEIRALAEKIPVTYADFPSDEILGDEFEPDILGLFVGNPYGVNDGGDNGLPAQIFLFLENIYDLAEGDLRLFNDEVRLTYLHELGHYLGWDEADLEARGLD